jgi:hypothetical protein
MTAIDAICLVFHCPSMAVYFLSPQHSGYDTSRRLICSAEILYIDSTVLSKCASDQEVGYSGEIQLDVTTLASMMVLLTISHHREMHRTSSHLTWSTSGNFGIHGIERHSDRTTFPQLSPQHHLHILHTATNKGRRRYNRRKHSSNQDQSFS